MSASLTLSELRNLVGHEVSVSEWMMITQAHIDMFAQATGDHQWIHVDPERCRTESPFKSTIAHGYMTLAMVPVMMGELCTPRDAAVTLNYGVNKVRYPAPLPVDSRVRGRIKLLSIDEHEQFAQLTWQVTIEREGSDKPVCIAEPIFRQYHKAKS